MINSNIGTDVKNNIERLKKFFNKRCPVNNGITLLISENSFRKICKNHVDKKNESCKICKIKKMVLFNKKFTPPKGVKFATFEEIKKIEDKLWLLIIMIL